METAKIIADVWENFQKLSKEEKVLWRQRHLQRVADQEQAELEEQNQAKETPNE